MGILDYNLDDVPELETVPDGEYQMEVSGAETKMSASGNPGILLRLKTDKPGTKGVTHWLGLPVEGEEQDKVDAKRRRLRDFAAAFGVTPERDNDEGMLGLTGWALLTSETSEEYGDQNRIKRFVNPK